MMRRAGIVCLLFALLAGTLVGPVDAAKGETRRAKATYELPYLGGPSIGGVCFQGTGLDNQCPTFDVSNTERWVKIDVADASGTPSPFEIRQKSDPSGFSSTTVGGPFCGSSGRKAVRLAPGVEVIVRVFAFGDVVCPGAFGTTGTVRAVFSNVP